MTSTPTSHIDEVGDLWYDVDDHGENRRTRWRRRTRARAIAKIDDPAQQSDSISALRRVTTCGLALRPDVTIRNHQGRCYAAGLTACGNIWTCPTCAARIRARRETEVEGALDTHVAGGGTIGMLTLTLQHDASMPLAKTIKSLNHAWQRLQQRRRFQPLYMTLTGTIATLEITTGTGNAGWHPHLHILLLVGPDIDEDTVNAAANRLRVAWSQLVNKKTTEYTIEHGLNLVWFGHESHIAARYVTKIAKEITLTDTKSGNDPFSLLDITGVRGAGRAARSPVHRVRQRNSRQESPPMESRTPWRPVPEARTHRRRVGPRERRSRRRGTRHRRRILELHQRSRTTGLD